MCVGEFTITENTERNIWICVRNTLPHIIHITRATAAYEHLWRKHSRKGEKWIANVVAHHSENLHRQCTVAQDTHTHTHTRHLNIDMDGSVPISRSLFHSCSFSISLFVCLALFLSPSLTCQALYVSYFIYGIFILHTTFRKDPSKCDMFANK